jgi:hypothetical protein
MKKPTIQQRLKAKKRVQTLVVGLTWYNEDTWAELNAAARAEFVSVKLSAAHEPG